MRKFVLAVKDSLCTDAVGVRLHEGDDYPYYTTIGFTESFVSAELSLCRRDGNGCAIRDRTGSVALDRMCGNVISGRTDSGKPFFTSGGSFCSFGTTGLLAGTTKEQRGSDTRDRCNGEGYETVCLVPIRDGDSVVGLLQVNDRREDAFDPSVVPVLEEVCLLFGEVIGDVLAEEAKVEAETRSMGLDLAKRIAEIRIMVSGAPEPPSV